MARRSYHNIRHLKKAAFLAAYRDTANIRRAAEAADIDRTTFYQWSETDEQFSLAFNQAKLDAKEALEEEARRRAVEGVTREKGIYHMGQLVGTEVITEYSDTLLIFLLKGIAPEKYRENIAVTQTQIVKTIDSGAWEAV